MKKEIALEQADLKELERMHFEYSASRDLVAYLLELHRGEEHFIEQDYFKKYQAQSVELFKEYMALKDKITAKYIPVELQTESNTWEAKFDLGIIEVRD